MGRRVSAESKRIIGYGASADKGAPLFLKTMMTPGEFATKQIENIKSWQFWRKDEEEFWVGMLMAEMASYTGSETQSRIADEIFEKYRHKSRKWAKRAVARTKK